MKRLMKKFMVMIPIMALLLGLGCVSSKGAAYLPIHKRPYAPFAIEQPQKAFLKCGDDYWCISLEHLEGLRVYTIEMEAIVTKYENATMTFNGIR
jgi:hypothetical protein